jgi:hypothetical protein
MKDCVGGSSMEKGWNLMIEIITAASNCLVQSTQKPANGRDIWWEVLLTTDTYHRFHTEAFSSYRDCVVNIGYSVGLFMIHYSLFTRLIQSEFFPECEQVLPLPIFSILSVVLKWDKIFCFVMRFGKLSTGQILRERSSTTVAREL